MVMFLNKTEEHHELLNEFGAPDELMLKNYPHETFRVRSLSDYLKVISYLNKNALTGEEQLAYRGMDDYRYILIPSLKVYTDSEGYAEPVYGTIENNLVMELLSQRPEEFKEIKSGLDLLAKMQHYGLPTRLLDFTLNPLVALYFACASNEEITGRVVCTIDTSCTAENHMGVIESLCNLYLIRDYVGIFLEDVIKDSTPITSYYVANMEPIMVRPKYYSERIKRQTGLFMVFPNTVSDKAHYVLHYGDNAIIPRWYNDEEGKRILMAIKERESTEDIYPESKEKVRMDCNDLTFSTESFQKITDKYRVEGMCFDDENAVFKEVMYKRFTLDDDIAPIPMRMIREQFCSILIEPSDKETIMKELDQVGINKAFLFPELEYTAERIKSKYIKPKTRTK